MAEPSTIARPYAAALFQASTAADGAQLVAQLDTLAGIAGDAGLRQFAADPKVSDEQVFGVVAGIAGSDLSPRWSAPSRWTPASRPAWPRCWRSASAASSRSRSRSTRR